MVNERSRDSEATSRTQCKSTRNQKFITSTLFPIDADVCDEVNEDDIVFCQVQPGDRFFAHLVSRKWFEDGEWYFTISNSKGWENGWCSIKHIYGRLVGAQH